MSEPLILKQNDTKCLNCGAPNIRLIISENEPGDLWIWDEPITHQNWACPGCGGVFCAGCFKIDYDGDGHSFFCPHCGVQMSFPRHDLYWFQLN